MYIHHYLVFIYFCHSMLLYNQHLFLQQLLYPFELVQKTDLDGKQSASYYLMLKTDNLREKCIRAIETAQLVQKNML